MARSTRNANPIIWAATFVAFAMAIVLVVLSIPDPRLNESPGSIGDDANLIASGTGISTSTPPPSATVASGLIPSPTPGADFVYAVQPGDTLWDIARRFDVTVEFIVNANPAMNSAELLQVGDEIVIPGVEIDPASIPGPEWPITGQVTADGEGLRLRTRPSLDG